MKTWSKTKWVLVAGMALALPVSGVLSGCGGGNGGLNISGGSGGGGGGGVNNSNFANVTGNSPLTQNGTNIGAVQFSVNNQGVITGSIAGNAITAGGAQRRNVTRATVSATSNVASDGTFRLVFNVNINGTPQTFTFSGKLTRTGNAAAIASVSFTSSAGGTFGTDFNVSVTSTGGTGTTTGTFSVSGGNSAGGSFSSNIGTASAIRSGGKITDLIISFNAASASSIRSLVVGVDSSNQITTGTYSIANDDGSAIYSERSVANPQNVKAWTATAGTIKVTSITASKVTVELSGVTLTPPTATPGTPPNSATGTISIAGSGSANIS